MQHDASCKVTRNATERVVQYVRKYRTYVPLTTGQKAGETRDEKSNRKKRKSGKRVKACCHSSSRLSSRQASLIEIDVSLVSLHHRRKYWYTAPYTTYVVVCTRKQAERSPTSYTGTVFNHLKVCSNVHCCN